MSSFISSSRAQALVIILGAALLTIAYTGAINLLGWRADFGESNFQTNMIRLQGMQRMKHAELALSGSSLMGRVLPDYFTATPSDPKTVLHLGLDGLGAGFSLQMLEKREALPKVVVVEANQITKPRDPANARSLLKAFAGGVNPLWHRIPVPQADHRPSTILYSKLKTYNDLRKDRRASKRGAPTPKTVAPILAPQNMRSGSPSYRLTDVERQAARQIEQKIDKLRARGAKILLVMLPDGSTPLQKQADYSFMKQLLEKNKVAFLDLLGEIPKKEMRYTDGRHLTRSSARQVAMHIALAVQTIDK